MPEKKKINLCAFDKERTCDVNCVAFNYRKFQKDAYCLRGSFSFEIKQKEPPSEAPPLPEGDNKALKCPECHGYGRIITGYDGHTAKYGDCPSCTSVIEESPQGGEPSK